MGVEWSIGCKKCKTHIWLGSQKSFKWGGFQIGDKIAKRFLSLHANCNNLDGNLLLINDGTIQVPWEADEERNEWKEDILSRSFCFDSQYQGNIVCADCNKELGQNEDLRKQNGNLMKNPFLWFCNENCFSNYIEFHKKERETFIYDSTKDDLPSASNDLFEIGCTICKAYVVIDNKENSIGLTKNFEYLALFLSEHVGLDHILKLNINGENILWRDIELKNSWKEYEF